MKISEKTIDRWANTAQRDNDDFALQGIVLRGNLFWALVPDEEQIKAFRSLAEKLGTAGLKGMIYHEHGDVSNSDETVAPPRVNISERNGVPTDAAYVKHLGDITTLQQLARFPLENNQ